MSFGVDVNILLYASDDTSEHHEKAAAFVRRCAAGPEVFCIAWLTAMSYLRMATHSRIFRNPLTPAQALGNIEALLSLPHCRAIGEDVEHLAVFRDITKAAPARANTVPDAHLAAVLRQNGVVTLYTHDRDFHRFDFLNVKDPLV